MSENGGNVGDNGGVDGVSDTAEIANMVLIVAERGRSAVKRERESGVEDEADIFRGWIGCAAEREGLIILHVCRGSPM